LNFGDDFGDAVEAMFGRIEVQDRWIGPCRGSLDALNVGRAERTTKTRP
jgi:hypothetical protein